MDEHWAQAGSWGLAGGGLAGRPHAGRHGGAAIGPCRAGRANRGPYVRGQRSPIIIATPSRVPHALLNPELVFDRTKTTARLTSAAAGAAR